MYAEIQQIIKQGSSYLKYDSLELNHQIKSQQKSAEDTASGSPIQMTQYRLT